MFYLDLFATLHRHEVEYVLIGGLVIALKRHAARPIDLADIAHLQRLSQP